MTVENIETLHKLLKELLRSAPCNGGTCVGSQQCDFGENCEYGDRCAIEDVMMGLK